MVVAEQELLLWLAPFQDRILIEQSKSVLMLDSGEERAMLFDAPERRMELRSSKM